MKMKKEYVAFLAFWAVNALLVFLSTQVSVGNFELGTFMVKREIAVFTSSFFWTLLVFISDPIVKRLGIVIKGSLNMMLFYFLVNFVALWITARLAPWTGFGISSALWVFVLALVANLAQYAAWMTVEKLQK